MRILSYIMLVIGAALAVSIIYEAFKFWKNNKGVDPVTLLTAVSQFIVYFLCAMGFPDFVMNTLFITKSKCVDLKRLPPSMYAAATVPGMIIGANYMRTGSISDIRTMIGCIIAMSLGCYFGARASINIKEKTLKRVIGVALIICMIALIIRLVLQNNTSGTATALTLPQMCVVLPIVFVLGFFNMFGIPMKPTSTAMFLICGLTPLATLSLILAMVSMGSLTGSVKVVHDRRYHRGFAVSGAIFGLIGSIFGLLVTISINATVLTFIMLAIMAFTSYTMLKPKKA